MYSGAVAQRKSDSMRSSGAKVYAVQVDMQSDGGRKVRNGSSENAAERKRETTRVGTGVGFVLRRVDGSSGKRELRRQARMA